MHKSHELTHSVYFIRCDDEDKVLTLHQERPVTLPGCPENALCPLKTILKLYEKSYHSCDFKEMCNYS